MQAEDEGHIKQSQRTALLGLALELELASGLSLALSCGLRLGSGLALSLALRLLLGLAHRLPAIRMAA